MEMRMNIESLDVYRKSVHCHERGWTSKGCTWPAPTHYKSSLWTGPHGRKLQSDQPRMSPRASASISSQVGRISRVQPW
eukprot:8730243-Heterocapsa_arctica.AAC.1